jgi:hypothetical protein
MGLIAQRCGVIPTIVEDPKLIHICRTDTREERDRGRRRLVREASDTGYGRGDCTASDL